jgi:6-phosphogluconolactonase (cycloisomerase 2 family)
MRKMRLALCWVMSAALTGVLLDCAPPATGFGPAADPIDFGVGDLTYVNRYRSATMDRPAMSCVSPDGHFVYVTAMDANAVFWFLRNPGTGALSVQGYYGFLDDQSPYDIEISPDGAWVYVTGHTGIVWLERNAADGSLTWGGSYADAGTLPQASTVTLTADGSMAYVTCVDPASPAHDVLAWFSRNPATGALTYLNRFEWSEYVMVRKVVVAPDGRHVYLARGSMKNRQSEIAWFSRDPDTGDIAYQGGYLGVICHDTRNLVMSADGANLYAAAAEANSIVRFTRDAATGALTYADYVTYDTVPSIEHPVWMEIAPDQRTLYVVSDTLSSVTWFARRTTTGEFEYQNHYQDESMIQYPGSVTVAPDGNTVYVTFTGLDGIAWFSRTH